MVDKKLPEKSFRMRLLRQSAGRWDAIRRQVIAKRPRRGVIGFSWLRADPCRDENLMHGTGQMFRTATPMPC
jgi:hypothetical protein